MRDHPRWLSAILAGWLLAGAAHAQPDTLPPPRKLAAPAADDCRPIDLPTALRLAGVGNPQIQIARQRVVEALAYRQLAAAQFLPTINVGTNLDDHRGPLQQSNGTILKVDRDALYVGLGAGAVSSGTVTVPGVVWNANVADVWYGALESRQVVRQRRFESEAIRNATLLQVASAYLELLRSTGRQAVAAQTRSDAAEMARVTANFAKTGFGRPADADRAATELLERDSDVIQVASDVQVASAKLCQLLSLDPSVRLAPMERQVLPSGLVPEPIPLPELLAIALTQRPELRQQQAAVRAAMLELQHAKVLPFSPQVLIGYSAGTFGGGSNLITPAQPRFGDFADREDFDVVLYWSLRNLGVGNVALIRLTRSQLRQSQLRELETLDRVRAEVASAQARVSARFAQIEVTEKAIKSSAAAFKQDVTRTRNDVGWPIEVLYSLKLLGRSRYAYLDAIVDYNRAQFELYVALGQPPADTLARPVPLGAPIEK
jgi:outer membrane protein TolC